MTENPLPNAGKDAGPRCLVGIEGCDCDDPYTFPDGTVMVPSFCECHDCYVCGEINCGGHLTCHCGEAVAYGYDGDPTHHRGMCEHCDAVRCDAYPGACTTTVIAPAESACQTPGCGHFAAQHRATICSVLSCSCRSWTTLLTPVVRNEP